MIERAYIDSKNILGILRRACNYVDPRLMDHGFRVAGIVWKILEEKGGYRPQEVRDICFLALLHDVGAYKTDEISRIVQFETEHAEDHAIYGYLFIRYFSPFTEMAPCILHHHTPWRTLEHVAEMSAAQKEIAQIIFLADRIDIGMAYERCGWAGCMERVRQMRGYVFKPELADLVLNPGFSVTKEELQWEYEGNWTQLMRQPYTADEINDFTMMLVYTIDFRSRHTVTHTITTTSVSWELAKLLGLDETYRLQIACGAILHDAGKIGVPVEILEFPGRLSPQAMTVMRTHVDMTEAIFGGEVDETVTRIALRHHEKLDGSGYPRGLAAGDLTVGERLVAVADIVSALTGTRSYKEAYSKERVVRILEDMKQKGLIDGEIVDVFVENYDLIMSHTQKQCLPLIEKYQAIQEEFRQMSGEKAREWLKPARSGPRAAVAAVHCVP